MPYNPTNPGPVVPPGQYGYPYPTHSGIYPGGSNGQSYGEQPYPSYPTQNTQYPYGSASGQPMPMPMPLDHAAHVQGAAPYPTGKNELPSQGPRQGRSEQIVEMSLIKLNNNLI